jgi:putative membrane protein
MWSDGPMAQVYGGDAPAWVLALYGAFWLAVAVVAALLVARLLADDPPCQRRTPAGMDVLEDRYARGEIGREEYLARRKDLAAHG